MSKGVKAEVSASSDLELGSFLIRCLCETAVLVHHVTDLDLDREGGTVAQLLCRLKEEHQHLRQFRF